MRDIQERLNEWARKAHQRIGKQGAASLVCDGVFGPLTLSAVKRFQDDKVLMMDGVVGPFTWSMLRSVPFAVEATHDARPVRQTEARLCWAASTEYWLRSHRVFTDQAQVIEDVRIRARERGIEVDRVVLGNGSLTIFGQPVWEERFGLTPKVIRADQFAAEEAAIWLRRAGKPMMLGTIVYHGTTGHTAVGHIRVLVGVETRKFNDEFAIALKLMDPQTASITPKMLRHFKSESPSGGVRFLVVWE